MVEQTLARLNNYCGVHDPLMKTSLPIGSFGGSGTKLDLGPGLVAGAHLRRNDKARDRVAAGRQRLRLELGPGALQPSLRHQVSPRGSRGTAVNRFWCIARGLFAHPPGRNGTTAASSCITGRNHSVTGPSQRQRSGTITHASKYQIGFSRDGRTPATK